MTRKKILWLCSWYPSPRDPFNGDFIQRHARAAALYHDIHVLYVAGEEDIALQQPEISLTETNGLTEEIIRFPRKKGWMGKAKAHWQWRHLYKQAIRRYISANGKPDWVHVHVPMKAGLMALWMKRVYGVPYLVTEHWGIYNTVVADHYHTQSRLFRLYTKKIVKGAAGLISVSRFLGEGMQRLVAPRPFTIVPNTVDTRYFCFREMTHDRFRFLHVSNMVPLKNVEGILRAFRQLLKTYPQAELTLVGNRDTLAISYAATLGLAPPSVTFHGEISNAGVAAQMQASDALVLFSDMENSPCVIGEALCCGLPVIATRTGGIPELVNEANGKLVPVRDEQGLVAAMEQMMLEKNRYNRAGMAVQAAAIFSYETIGRAFDRIYAGATP